EKAVEVLEAIKLFVDAPGCVFVLGLDQAVIARGIEIKYREFEPELAESGDGASRRRSIIDGARYLEKIIQLPFQIPPIERSDMGAFVQALVAEWPHAACPEVFAEGLGQNPRQVKRTVNVFLLLWQLAGRRQAKLQDRIKPIRLAKVVAIQHIYPELYDLLKTTPRLLRELEAYYRAEESRPAQPAAPPDVELEAAQETAARLEPPPALAPFVSRAAVRRVLTMHPADLPEANFNGLPPDELRLYFTLTRRAEAPQVAPTEAARAPLEPQLVRVPAGSFLMGSTEEQMKQAIAKGLDEDLAKAEQPQHAVELPDYFIGKYPVTHAEYQVFVRETGHQPPRHWDGETYPDEKGDHPVVNVSWSDAVAYCQWLSEKTGKLYRLPTEAEWEKAARGADGRLYPWGHAWDPARLNSGEGGAGDTTPVGQYSPEGDSFYGAADMAGNVWEWTLSLFKSYPYDSGDGREELEEHGLRVLRGGSFNNNLNYARCAARFGNLPDFWFFYFGFRVVVSPISPASAL
ncbi:MAG TPA: SUMF1/EgtB/PvdO family nonheme iron enzyme, partial [Anaerolineae bacterium]